VNASLIILLLAFGNNPYGITLFITIYSFLFPILYPSIIAKSLSLFPNHKGSASSLNYCLRSFSVWLGTIIGGIIYNNTLIPASLCLLVVSFCALFLYLLSRKLEEKQSVIKPKIILKSNL
jgi:predicted MFS family arabinose efflux permease